MQYLGNRSSLSIIKLRNDEEELVFDYKEHRYSQIRKKKKIAKQPIKTSNYIVKPVKIPIVNRNLERTSDNEQSFGKHLRNRKWKLLILRSIQTRKTFLSSLELI